MTAAAGQAKGLNDYARAVARTTTGRAALGPAYGNGERVGACDLTSEGRILFYRPIRDTEHEPGCGKKPCSCWDPWMLVVVREPYDHTPGRLVRPSHTNRVDE